MQSAANGWLAVVGVWPLSAAAAAAQLFIMICIYTHTYAHE